MARRYLSADMPELRSVLRDIRGISPDLAKAVRRNLRAEAKKVSDDARRRAPKESGKLARSISPRVSSSGQSSIVAKSPYSKIHEFGGRHPVYGNRDVWVKQEARPYMLPAVKDGREDFFKAADAALKEAAKKARFM